MRLFFVRHGESVDNVAGLYAGSRDSALTAHGVVQARRLAEHLIAGRGLSVTRIFSSNLQRASKTAQAIVDVQKKRCRPDLATQHTSSLATEVTQLADLRERDFRSAEGSRFGKPRGGAERANLDDAESKEEMRVRAGRFIEQHLAPLFADTKHSKHSVVVVSHGIILNILLSLLLRRFAPSEMARLAAQQTGAGGSHPHADLLLSWRNTGYLEVDVDMAEQPATPLVAEQQEPLDDSNCPDRSLSDDKLPARSSAKLAVVAINSVEHLQGLQKTRGGIGSAAFDRKQKTMDNFFGPSIKRSKKE